MAAPVSTPVFEGPFDVLLRLVSEHKLDVFDIPVADVVDAFVSELQSHEKRELDQVSEFLLIAAILVELKSKKLLPGPDEVEDDEELLGNFEERDRLLARLLELQAYAGAAGELASMMERAARSVARIAGLDDQFRDLAPDLLEGVTGQRLAASYASLLAQDSAAALDLSHVTVEAVTVSEAVAELEERLPSEQSLSFRELCSACTTRMQVIVRFLALLELCKQGRVNLEQGETFGDLLVSWVSERATLSTVGAREVVEEYEG